MYTKPLVNRKVIDSSSTNPDIYCYAADRIPTGFPSEQRGWRACAQHWLSSQRQRPRNAWMSKQTHFCHPGNSGKSTWLLDNSTFSVAGHKDNISCRLCECFRHPVCSSWCSKFRHNFTEQIKVVGWYWHHWTMSFRKDIDDSWLLGALWRPFVNSEGIGSTWGTQNQFCPPNKLAAPIKIRKFSGIWFEKNLHSNHLHSSPVVLDFPACLGFLKGSKRISFWPWLLPMNFHDQVKLSICVPSSQVHKLKRMQTSSKLEDF